MRASFKNKKSNNALDKCFTKDIGDITYELEIYPKFLYFEKITDKGEKPH